MTTLAVEESRPFESHGHPFFNDLPVIASDKIFEGSAVGENGSGNMRPLVAGDPFMGFASKSADNSSGSAGDVDVHVRQYGAVQLTVTGVSAVTDIGKPVYASDDNAFTLTAGVNSLIGSVMRWVTSTTAIVSFQATQIRQIGLDEGFIGLDLNSWRETSNFDVGNLAAHGGILASDSTPALDAINAATDGSQRVLWVSSNNDQITRMVPLPLDIDYSKDMTLTCNIVSGGTTNAVGFTVDTFWDEGDTKVVDTTGTNQTTTQAEVTATIAAADIPSGARKLTIGLTPVAHTTDTLAMNNCYLTYTKRTR